MAGWYGRAKGVMVVLTLLVSACGGATPEPTATLTPPAIEARPPANPIPTEAVALATAVEDTSLECLPDCTAANLQGADLQGADLAGATLSGAYLRLANLGEARLEGADLHWAQLDGANLAGADLDGAFLRGANLRPALPGDGACPGDGAAEASGQGPCAADLSGASLYGTDLRDTDLSQAVLTGADLSQANLEGAVLHAAQLQEAVLEGANLRGADLRRADLTGASLLGADLYDTDRRGAQISEEQLAQALQDRAGLRSGGPLVCTRHEPEGLSGPIWDVEPAPDGTVWVAAFEGLVQFNPRSARWRAYDLEEALGGARVRSLTAAPDGTLWLALRLEEGAVHWDGRRWTRFRAEDGLISDEVNSVSVGPDGSVWFATRAGATHWEPKAEKWTSYGGLSQLAGESVWRVLFTSDGKIWFAQQGGVTSWLPAPEAEPGEMSETGTPPAGATAQPTASAEPVEDVWESLRAFPYLGNREATVATDGRLWLAHAVYEPASGLWERTAYDEIQLYDLAPDAHGGLWIARRDGALYLPDGVSSPRDEWLLFGTPEGLPSDQVTVVALEGEDLLWIGTEDGLVRCEVPPIAQATP